MQPVKAASCPAMPVVSGWLGQARLVAMQASYSGEHDIVQDGLSSYHDSPAKCYYIVGQHRHLCNRALHRCTGCKQLYCFDCDLYIHEALHVCPGCEVEPPPVDGNEGTSDTEV